MRKLILITTAFIFSVCLAQAQVVSTTTGGDWSNPATWVGSVVPAPTDAVIIADDANVVLDVNATVLSLTVGQGNSGLLRFQPFGAVTLTVSSDVLINPGATFRTSFGIETGHELIVGGSLTNNGNLNFSTNFNLSEAGITFIGAANATFGGSGSITDIARLTVDKGNSAASVLELSPANFTHLGLSNTPGTLPGFLNIINGTFKIGGTFTMNNGLFTGLTNYTIPPTGGLWMANPNFVVEARNGTAYLEGTLIMDAGVLNVGTADGDRLGYIDGSVVTINGGEINVASRFTATTTFGLTYTQTGGTMRVNTVANSRQTYACFDIRPLDNSTFNMSGGRIVIQNANNSGVGPRDYNVMAVNNIVTGGTLQIGNAATTGINTFYIYGVAPNLEINNASGPLSVKLLGNTSVLNTDIQAGCTLNLHDDVNGYVYTQKGAQLQNDGSINGTVAGSGLQFSGELGQPQQYAGAGTILAPLASLTISNTQTVSFNNTVPQDIITQSLSLNAGDISLNGNILVLGTDAVNTGAYSYTSGTLLGKFRRWISASTSSYDFPVGVSGLTRNAAIDFTGAPAAGGTLTTEFIPQAGGFNGLPITEGLNTILNTASEGYWRVSAADGLAGGTYTGAFTANGFTTITDYTRLVLVKRTDENAPWVLDGTHIPASGSNALAVVSRSGMTGFSDFAVGGDLIALPVTIEYFKGRNSGDRNVLDWQVSCTNTPGVNIELQRSFDGRT